MAKVPPLVVPRLVSVAGTSPDVVPRGALLRAQSGKFQTRDFDRAGRGWKEDYNLVSTRRIDDQNFLTRMQWLKARVKLFWVDHPLMPGSGLPILGQGRENLVRDAAMDTEDGATGVVLSFGNASSGTGWTFSVNGTAGAQTISADGTGANGDEAEVHQVLLRVYPTDQVAAGFDARLQTPADLQGAVRIEWLDENGSEVGTPVESTFTATSFGRRSVVGTAPDGAFHARIVALARLTAAGGSGDAEFRDARFLRAASDPSSWQNPHVDGASQTGNTLDTAGWPASTRVLEAGDVFKVGGSGESVTAAESDEIHRSFKVLAPVDSDAGGLATIPIDPAVFTGLTIPDGAALRFEKMRMRAALESSSGLDATSQSVDKFGGLSATFIEAI